MNHHRRMETTLLRYHDGVLDGRLQGGLEQHLQECARCRQELQRLEETDALLACARPVTPELSPAEQDQLFRVALVASNVSRRAGWQQRWRLATAALVMAGVVGGLVWQHHAGDHVVIKPAESTLPAAIKLLATDNTRPSQQVQRFMDNPPAVTEERWRGKHHARRRIARRSRPRPVPKQPMATLVARTDPPRTMGLPLEELLPAEPQLLVLASRPVPELTVSVSVSSDQPGYAKAVFLVVTPTGTQVETQATISSCNPGDLPERTSVREASPLTEAPNQDLTKQPERENSDGME